MSSDYDGDEEPVGREPQYRPSGYTYRAPDLPTSPPTGQTDLARSRDDRLADQLRRQQLDGQLDEQLDEGLGESDSRSHYNEDPGKVLLAVMVACLNC